MGSSLLASVLAAKSLRGLSAPPPLNAPILTLIASIKMTSILGREEAAICVCFCALANWLAERVAQAGMVFFTFFSFSFSFSTSFSLGGREKR